MRDKDKHFGGRQMVRAAHEAGCETTGLAFSLDGSTMLSRSADSTLKVRSQCACLQLVTMHLHPKNPVR